MRSLICVLTRPYRRADTRLAKKNPSRSLLSVNEGEIFERNAVDACEIASLQGDCLVGANIRATTALDAGISVNNINIASRDSLYGALADAATTSYTFFGVNFVSHNLCLLKKFIVFVLLFVAQI